MVLTIFRIIFYALELYIFKKVNKDFIKESLSKYLYIFNKFNSLNKPTIGF